MIYSLPSRPTMSSSLGGSASGEGGSSSISMSSSIEVELWSQFETTIRSMISSGAQLTVSPSDGTITITATAVNATPASFEYSIYARDAFKTGEVESFDELMGLLDALKA